MRLSAYLPVVIAIVLAAGASLLAARVAVDRIEASARAGILQALKVEDLTWAEVSVDGLQVVLTGEAPDEAARFGALSAAGTVIDATRIIDRMDVRPAQTIAAPEFKIEILRNLDGVSLIGLVPAATDRTEILDQIGRFANAPVTDLMENADFPEPENWDRAVGYALGALSRIPRSKVSVTANAVSVTGIVDSEQVRRRIETELARTVPSGVRLALDISAPRPVIAPFTTRFVIDEAGRRFDACAAETPEGRDAILAAARAVGLTGTVGCRIGLGAPSLEWAEAVGQGLAALADLGEGSITFADADVSLVVPHTVDQIALDRRAGALERTLPEGFSLTAIRTPPPPEAGAEESEERIVIVFSATLDPETGVELFGRLPTERSRAAVESYAHAHFGLNATVSSMRLADDLPEGWSLKAITALDALSHLAAGSVRITPDNLTIKGVSGQANAAGAISGLLSAQLGSGAQFTIDVAYEERLDPTSDLPTPEECVAQLNAILELQKVSFEPGSAVVDGDGLEIIDRLADVIRTCEGLPMEIGGHTDSQGRESMNERLSQDRANAVLNALMARRVLTTGLVARGYGETRPIADNDTEEGREANRRIEFTLLVPDETMTEEAEDGEETETAEETTDEQN